ncbi:PspC domain-containing protein [Nocardia sp. NPDC127526]|uniref:PspC domain-containing protein n=1 Tax=Nocardia sp. NPDC127526 TaxID=3345393 RepID=UPI0036327027
MTRTSDGSTGTGRAKFADQVHDMWRTRPVRLPHQGPIAGVAAGFGRRYNVDPVLVRVAFVVSALFGGAGIVLYLLAWLLLSQEGDQTSAAESLFGKGQSSQHSSKTIVLMVALGIAVSTMGPVGVGLGGSGAISMVLMLAGWWLLHQRQPQPPAGYLDYAGDPIVTGYPVANSPYWTGYPGTTAPFETYGPYTKLPDHYEPEPDPRRNAEAPTEVLAKQSVAPAAEQSIDEATDAGAAAGWQDTAVLRAEPPTLQDVPPAHTDPDTQETVVLHKPDAAVEGAESGASGDVSPSPEEQPKSTPTSLVKSATTASPSTGASSPDSEPRDAAAEELAEPRDLTPVAEKPSALHRIPPTGERPYATYGPAPISPEFGPTPPGWDPLGVAPMAWDLPEPAPAAPHPVQAPPRRPRSRFTPVIIGFSLLAAAAAGAVAAAGAEWMTPGRIGAAALAVIGLGLIIGAFLRRGYGLMVVLAPLAGFVILSSLIGPIEFDRGSMGDRAWVAATASELQPEYHVSMGTGTLDLSNLKLDADRSVELSVRMGDARVLLPQDLRVNTICNVGMGDSNCVNGMSGPPTGPVLNLTVDVQMGTAEVNRG